MSTTRLSLVKRLSLACVATLALLSFACTFVTIQNAQAQPSNVDGISWEGADGTIMHMTGSVKPSDITAELDTNNHRQTMTKIIVDDGCHFNGNPSELFKNCTALTEATNIVVGNDVSKPTTSYMFAGCTKLTSISIYMENTILGAQGMFQNCTSLTTITSLDPSGSIQLHNIRDMKYMFQNCSSLPSVKLSSQDIWTSRLISEYNSMFEGCSALTSITQDATGLVLSPQANCDNMFKNCTSLDDPHVAGQTQDGSFASMFEGCTSLETCDLEQLTVSSQTSNINFSSIFKGCTNLSDLNIRAFMPSSSYTLQDTDAFSGCTDLHDVVLASSYVPSVASQFPFTSSWFAQAGTVSEQDPLTSRDDFVALAAKYPNTNIEYWLAMYVNYDANGGTFTTAPTDVHSVPFRYDQQIQNIADTQITRTNYRLLGWAYTKDATTPTLDPSAMPIPIKMPSLTIYAVWQPLTITVTFSASPGAFPDGTDTQTKSSQTSTQTLELPANPIRQGYDFAGWAGTQGAGVPDIVPGQSSTVPTYGDAMSHYYAVWRVDNVVAFSANGGIFPSGSDITTTSGHAADTLNLPTDAPSREGYTFLGWAITSEATTPSIPPLPTYEDASPTYFAVWSEKTKTVMFEANGGSWTDSQGQVTTEASTTGKLSAKITLPATPVWTGHDFIGWAETQAATTPDIDPGDTATYPTYSNAATTYYALWVDDATVIFNANGGVFDGGAISTKIEGSLTATITLPASPQRTYFTFVGWATTRDAETPDMPDPLPTFDEAEGIYYAVWKPTTDTVSFYANGGKFDSGQIVEATQGPSTSRITLPTAPTWAGHNFLGWAEASAATEPDIDPADSATYPEYRTAASAYYAVWQVASISVDFSASGGFFADGGTMWKTTGSALTTLALPDPSPTRDGFDFAGWASAPDSHKPEIIPGQASTIPLYVDASAHYYAVWRQDDTVLFSANGGVFEGGATEQTTTGYATATLTLPEVNPRRSGYEFVGWASTASATTPDLLPPYPAYEDAAPTYFAVWSELQATVTFNANGGAFQDGATEQTTEGSRSSLISLPESSPSKPGAHFVGWAASATATTPQIVPSDTATYPTYRNAASTYWAVWVAETTVVFDANGGTFADGNVQVSYTGEAGDTITLPANPSRTLFRFMGWASTKDADAADMPSPLPTYATSAGVYYAVWQPYADVVEFQANGGTFAGGQTVAATQGSPTSIITLPDAPSWVNHTFVGWSASQTAINPQIVPGDATTYPSYGSAASEYYAVWVSANAVLYNANGGTFADGTRTQVEEGPSTDVILLPGDPTRDAYDFLGWADVAGASVPNMPLPLPTYGEAARVYYAVWRHVSGHWEEDAQGWKYVDDSGNYIRGQWASIDGTTYYFKDNCYMAQNEWLDIAGRMYYFYADGNHATGWAMVDGTWYYFDASGHMLTGWVEYAGQWYYLSDAGTIQTGWLFEGGAWYWLGDDGVMETGWHWVDTAWYYMSEDDGQMLSYAWSWIGNAWYYFDGSGAMSCSGWYWIESAWYYFGFSGDMYMGWQWIGNAWYYLGTSGDMHQGWVWDGGWYYLNVGSGDMARNCWVGAYWVNNSGLWVY